MKLYIALNDDKNNLYNLVLKFLSILLMLVILSVLSAPGDVFGAENLTLVQSVKNKKDTSLVLSSQNNNYPSITDVDQTGLDITGNMTIALWAKPTSLVSDKILVSKWEHTSKTSYLLYFVGTNIAMTLNSIDSGYGYKTFSVPYSKNLNEWAHIVMVYTAASGTVEFFINGVSAGKSADFAMPTSIANTDASFIIGTRENHDAQFQGSVDDVRIWSRSLSSSEVTQLYKHPKKFDNGSLLQGYWKFNGNFNDESGNGNSLGTIFSSDTPF
jgi:hypothetical protein